MGRDWLKSFWPASFKGAPFWTEVEQEPGGRRIVVHEFPMRDDPYLEDLGESAREFDLTAYLASDTADAAAIALTAVCSARGAGILVLPVQGPVLVRCDKFKREDRKDRAGFVAYSLHFYREGAATAMVSVPLLANLVFVAADALAIQASVAFVSGIALSSVPDYVTDGMTSQVQDVAATLEAVRSSEPVEAGASAIQRRAIADIFSTAAVFTASPISAGDASQAVTTAAADAGELTSLASVPLQVIAIARGLGDALAPSAALRAFGAILDEPAFASKSLAVSYPTLGFRAQAQNEVEANQLLRLAALTVYCEGVARVALPDRPAGITLRANVAEYFETELGDLPASEIDLARAIATLRDATITYLSRAILDLAPVIRVEANMSMPSLFWAWRLYQDPSRTTDLVERNRVAHPSFMPPEFEALAR